MGIFSPSTKQRLDELEQKREDIKDELLIQAVFKASPIEYKAVYDYFLTFKVLDYSVYKNRERLIEMFVRKIVLFDDGKKKIYYNCSDDKSGEINDKSELEIGFGFEAFGTTKGNRTPVSGVRGQRPNR